jgi:glutamate 5-kinase
MRDFSDIRRVVIKIGTKILSGPEGVDESYIRDMARQVGILKKKDLQILIVTSGAIGIGAGKLGLEKKVTQVDLRQACAAIGQPLLMHDYDRAFSAEGFNIAQVLVSRENFNDRETFLNLKNAVETLLERGVIPVFNENDSVSTREIGSVFGDNDSLSAHIASKLDAGLLVLLSDIDALYDSNPRENSGAKALDIVENITGDIRAAAGSAGSEFATGGMETKLDAVNIARRAGCRVVLAHGREKDVLPRTLDGEKIGTLFLAGKKMSSRKRWIWNAQPKGRILVDAGAVGALKANKSLLPSGVLDVEGFFNEGEVVLINDSFKAVTSLNSSEIKKVMGRHSKEIPAILGKGRRDDISRPEDIVEIGGES